MLIWNCRQSRGLWHDEWDALIEKWICRLTLADQHILNDWARRGAYFWSRRAFQTPCFLGQTYLRQKRSWYRKQTSLSDCRTSKMTELVEFVYDKEASAYERTDGISSVEINLSWFVQSSLLRLKNISQERYRFLRKMSCERCQIVKEKMYKDANW